MTPEKALEKLGKYVDPIRSGLNKPFELNGYTVASNGVFTIMTKHSDIKGIIGLDNRYTRELNRLAFHKIEETIFFHARQEFKNHIGTQREVNLFLNGFVFKRGDLLEAIDIFDKKEGFLLGFKEVKDTIAVAVFMDLKIENLILVTNITRKEW